MLHRPRVISLFSVALLLACFLSARPARAQCGPDGLDPATCCSPAQAILPTFPSVVQNTRWICFDGCLNTGAFGYCTTLGVPIPQGAGGAIVCGLYSIRVRIRDCGSGATYWNGSMNAYFSRTWGASSVAGTVNLQVWRFVVNGDLLPTALLPVNPCQKPACMPTFSRVYFSGYVDYAFDCSAGTWQVAWSISHECDGIHHAPGTGRPAPAGGLHASRSFTIIGPDAGFVVAPTSPQRSNGQIVQEAMRKNNWAALPSICLHEERAQGSFLPQTEFCFCSTGGNQYVQTAVTATGSCGSGVAPSALGPLFQKRIGRWTNPAVYPGVQFLLFDFGWLATQDGCTGAGTQEWYEGVETVRGYPAVDFQGLPLGPQFEDLGSCNASATAPATLIGRPHVVNWFLNFNLP